MTYRNGTSIDRRWLDWHYTLPRDFSFMDLDGVGFCHRCKEPLFLVETSRDPAKATTVMRRIAQRADLPAVLIIVPDELEVLTHEVEVTFRSIWPPKPAARGPLNLWERKEQRLREQHSCAEEPKP